MLIRRILFNHIKLSSSWSGILTDSAVEFHSLVGLDSQRLVSFSLQWL